MKRSSFVTYIAVSLFSATVFADPGCEKLARPSKSADRQSFFGVNVILSNPSVGVKFNDGELEWNRAAEVRLVNDSLELCAVAGETLLVVFPQRSHALHHVGGMPSTTYRGLRVRKLNRQRLRVRQSIGGAVPENRIVELYGRVPETVEFAALKKNNDQTTLTLNGFSTRAEFDAMSEVWKVSALESLENPNLIIQSDTPQSKLKSAEDRAFANAMKERFLAAVSLEPEKENYAAVGAARFTFTIARTKSGELLGGRIFLAISGMSTEGSGAWYPNKSAAEKAGAHNTLQTIWLSNASYAADLKVIAAPTDLNE